MVMALLLDAAVRALARSDRITPALLHQWSERWGQSTPWSPRMPVLRTPQDPPDDASTRGAGRPRGAAALPRTWTSVIGADAAIPSTYGIARGTWIAVRLVRRINRISARRIELRVRSDVAGQWHMLPRNTLLFARARYNLRTGRLDGSVTHGLTPSGASVRIQGVLFDRNRERGLPALAGVHRADHQPGAVARWMSAQVQGLSPTPLVPDLNGLFHDRPRGGFSGAEARIYVAPQPAYLHIEQDF